MSAHIISDLLQSPENIRNLSVIAHVDHGKSSLVDSLISIAGIETSINPSEVGKRRATDTMEEEIQRGITIRSTGVSLLFKVPASSAAPSRQIFCNLIDSPGHIDFSAEVTAALRVTDGSLVLVDCLAGVSIQTETVLRQSLAEKVKPTLVINKLDRIFLEHRTDLEQVYLSLRKIVEDLNVQISMFSDPKLPNWQVDPLALSVVFASGYQGWAFSLMTFAKIYAAKFASDPERLASKLWGDWYYDASRGKWVTDPVTADGRVLQRSFCEFILAPLQRIVLTALQAHEKPGVFLKLLQKLQIPLSLTRPDVLATAPRELMRAALQKWLPAGDALRDLIVQHLPSPVEAQRYRAAHLYSGPADDETCRAIQACDPEGPLVFYVSKLVPTDLSCSRFYAFGRVFSGTLRPSLPVLVPKASASNNSAHDEQIASTSSEGDPALLAGPSARAHTKASIQNVFVAMCAKFDPISAIPAGSTGAVMGLDKIIAKTGTVITHPDSFPLHTMNMVVSPVVRTAISVKNSADIPKLSEALRRLLKTDSTLELTREETGEQILAATGELHLEIAIGNLVKLLPASCALVTSPPLVSFRETITAHSEVCLAKSANKLNRVWFTAEPLGEELTAAIESGAVRTEEDMKSVTRRRLLVEKYGWDANDASRVWAFGPDGTGPNVLVDKTSGAQYLQEVKDSIVAAFNWVAGSGVLMNEPLRGVRFNIVDVSIHSDPSHRGARELIPASRRAMLAAMLTAAPRVQEPLAAVNINVTSDFSPAIHSLVGQKRGCVHAEKMHEGTPMVDMDLVIPLVQTFGLNAELRSKTSGKALMQLGFASWETLAADPLSYDSLPGGFVKSARLRKKLPEAIPPVEYYRDKL